MQIGHKNIKKYLWNKYTITTLGYLCFWWLSPKDSLVMINHLDAEIRRLTQKRDYFKSEYEKNNASYQKLMSNKQEREKFARENYFMKRRNEEIFIIIPDTIPINANKSEAVDR